ITRRVVDGRLAKWQGNRMPRPRGPHGARESTVIAVRVPDAVLQRIYAAAGATSGPQLAEWHRNALRRAVSVPLDYKAGYEEGKAAGWTDAQERLRAALKGA